MIYVLIKFINLSRMKKSPMYFDISGIELSISAYMNNKMDYFINKKYI